MKRPTFLWLGLSTYIMLQAAVIGGLFFARHQARELYGSPAAQASWNEFRQKMDDEFVRREQLRTEMARESGQPEAARPPKERSERPPAWELLENHFAACLATLLAFTTVLFLIFWLMLAGVFLRPGRSIPAADQRPN